MSVNSGQCSDPGPLLDGCDPERCTDRVGGDHAETCRVEMTFDEAEAAGLDGTGRDGDPRFPHAKEIS